MPLWLQGALETAQAAVISALVVIAPIVAVWATAGFQNGQFEVLARLGRARPGSWSTGYRWCYTGAGPAPAAHGGSDVLS